MNRDLSILIISQYFPPELGALASRTYEHSLRWVKMGYRVTVISNTPNHPSGKIFPGYKNKLMQEENVDGIRVIRTWVYPAPHQKPWERIANYASFIISSTLGVLFISSRIDVVVASSPQLLVGIVGYVASRLKGCPFVFEVRDLWPESVSDISPVRSGFFIRLLNWLANFLYNKADKVVAVSPAIREVILSKGYHDDKVEVIPNGVDPQFFKPAVKESMEIRERLNIDSKFIVSYVGTIGLAHGLGVVLEAAKRLERYEEFVFLLVGEGAEKEKLIKRRTKIKSKNVLFVPGQPKSEMPGFLSAIDIGLVLLRKREVFKTVIPSKMFEIMAAQKPMILGVEGQAREILEVAGAGIPIEPENVDQLCCAIIKLCRDRDLRKKFGFNGRHFVEKNYNRDTLAAKYQRLLMELIERKD